MIDLGDLIDLIQDVHIATARDLEQETISSATGRAEDILADALATALTDWIRAFGSSTAPGHGPELDRILAVVQERVHLALLDLAPLAREAAFAALPVAYQLGIDQALQVLRSLGETSTYRIGKARKLLKQVQAVTDTVADYLDAANRLLGVRPDSFPKLAAVLKTARKAVSRVQSGLAWIVHQTVNSGAAAVADAFGLGLLWVAETDACVRCAAYSGEVAAPGEAFPGGLSYDPEQRNGDATAVGWPPLHPHCRCRVVPWSAKWGTGLSDLLRRQADRSVARGWSLPSESGPARVRAARDLLASGRPLPPSVAARARKAVAAGRFTAA